MTMETRIFQRFCIRCGNIYKTKFYNSRICDKCSKKKFNPINQRTKKDIEEFEKKQNAKNKRFLC